MTQTTSSAEYLKLYHYSDAALQLDNNLVGEANRLRGALLHFEATCRERAFRLSVAHVADGMVMYGARAAVVDAWVRVVGLGFQAADGGGLAALLPSWLPPWLLWPLPIQPSPEDRRPFKLLPVEPPSWLPPWLLPITLPPWFDRIFFWPGETGQQIPDPLGPVVVKPPTEDDDKGSSNDGETELGKLLRPHVEPEPTTRQPTILSQLFPEETDSELLKAKRYLNPSLGMEAVKWAPGGVVTTVSDHIYAYGCRMTCLVMVLRDLGKDVTISKLYRATYNEKQKGKRTIEEDLAHEDDGQAGADIIYEDLYPDWGDDAVSVVSNKEYKVETAPKLANTTDALKAALKDGGPLIIHTIQDNADGHWIIVDSYNEATGTFSVRNPNRSLDKVQIPSAKIPGDYDLQGEAIRVKPQ